MGTKANPGQFDCYANAAPDEPMFILLGRDKHAATLVRLWALLRHRDGEHPAKVEEALACADAMEHRAQALNKVIPDAERRLFDQLLTAVTEGMADHPENFDHPCECDECRSYGEPE